MHYLSQKLKLVAAFIKWEALKADKPGWAKELHTMHITVNDTIDLLNLKSNNVTTEETKQTIEYLEEKVIKNQKEIELLKKLLKEQKTPQPET